MTRLFPTSFSLLIALSLASVSSATTLETAERPWTLLIYGAADNNADGPILNFLDDIRKAWDDDPGMELVLFLDRSEGFSADATMFGEDFTGGRIYRLRSDSTERLDGGDEFPEVRLDREWEPDSADPQNLAKFLRFGKARFPARNTGLMIYGHADGRAMCPDEQSGNEMGIAALSHELEESDGVDFTGLELCNMGGVEIAYQWRPGNGGFSTRALVAIPNAGPPLDWARSFARIRSGGHATASPHGDLVDPATMSGLDFGRLIVEEGERGRRAHAGAEGARVAFEAAACYDLEVAGELKEAVDELAVALWETDGKGAFEELRGPGPSGIAMNYARDAVLEVPYFDLYDLLVRCSDAANLDESVREVARAAAELVDEFVTTSFGMPGLGEFENGLHGVFIVCPDGDAPAPNGLPGSRAWADCGWYSPGDPGPRSSTFGRWSWCADGADPDNGQVENWFELLDAWYDVPGAGPGGLNGYQW